MMRRATAWAWAAAAWMCSKRANIHVLHSRSLYLSLLCRPSLLFSLMKNDFATSAVHAFMPALRALNIDASQYRNTCTFRYSRHFVYCIYILWWAQNEIDEKPRHYSVGYCIYRLHAWKISDCKSNCCLSRSTSLRRRFDIYF